MANEKKSEPDISKMPGIGELPMKSLEAEIEQWKKDYGEIHAISVPFGEHEFNGIFRVPNEKDVESSQRKELSGLESNREFCRRTVLYPNPMQFHDLVQRNWAFCTPIAEKLIELTNLTAKAKVKKL
ncbi:MAG: hypothetical protein J0L53_07170 [Spirochaetes bacterium]|nr:hypothetical protein [Spirochaetota bacterium]